MTTNQDAINAADKKAAGDDIGFRLDPQRAREYKSADTNKKDAAVKALERVIDPVHPLAKLAKNHTLHVIVAMLASSYITQCKYAPAESEKPLTADQLKIRELNAQVDKLKEEKVAIAGKAEADCTKKIAETQSTPYSTQREKTVDDEKDIAYFPAQSLRGKKRDDVLKELNTAGQIASTDAGPYVAWGTDPHNVNGRVIAVKNASTLLANEQARSTLADMLGKIYESPGYNDRNGKPKLYFIFTAAQNNGHAELQLNQSEPGTSGAGIQLGATEIKYQAQPEATQP